MSSFLQRHGSLELFFIQFSGLSMHDDLAVFHHVTIIGDIHDEFQILLGDKHSHLLFQFCEYGSDFLDDGRLNTFRRFIQNEDLRTGD